MPESHLRIRQTASSLEIALHVQPRARRSEVAGVYNGALKVKVVAPPVENAANDAVINFFASLMDIPKSRLKIISGKKSREKVLGVEGVTESEFLSRLPAILQ